MNCTKMLAALLTLVVLLAGSFQVATAKERAGMSSQTTTQMAFAAFQERAQMNAAKGLITGSGVEQTQGNCSFGYCNGVCGSHAACIASCMSNAYCPPKQQN